MPTVVRRGRAAAIAFTGGDVATGHDPGTGKAIWRVKGPKPQDAHNFPALQAVYMRHACITS